VHQELRGKNIHRLENIMTLDSPIHHYFDTLRFWLEPTVSTKSSITEQSATEKTPFFSGHTSSIPHLLRGPFNPKRLRYDLSEFIVLTTPDAARLPLPNPDYLALHASCCRIAHGSGAAGFLEWMDNHEDSFSSPVPSEDLSATLTARLLFLETQSGGRHT
jgi:hypothetical protein